MTIKSSSMVHNNTKIRLYMFIIHFLILHVFNDSDSLLLRHTYINTPITKDIIRPNKELTDNEINDRD